MVCKNSNGMLLFDGEIRIYLYIDFSLRPPRRTPVEMT